MIKKMVGVGILVMLVLLIMVVPMSNAQGSSGAGVITPSAESIIQGKVSGNGILFFVLEKQPLVDNYCVIQPNVVMHDPNLEIYIFNPNEDTAVKFTVEEYQLNASGLPTNITYGNVTFLAPTDQIVQEFTTIDLTVGEEYIDLGINGTFYNALEQYEATPPIPFYEQGEVAYLGFVMVMSGLAIMAAFATALGLLRRAKYFPPIRLIYILIVGVIAGVAGDAIITTNYYEVIQTRWEYYFVPLYVFFVLLFLSNIPTKIQKGLLLRFMSDRGNGEIRTQFMIIHTSEMELLEQKDMRHSGMEYIDSRSYLDFLKRLVGIHTPIYFSQGELPAEVEKPERITQKTLKFRLKNTFKFRNVKRDPNDFDFGYLLDSRANPEVRVIRKDEIKNEVPLVTSPSSQGDQEEKKRRVFQRIRKYRILHIGISGHHSKLMEEFLSGLNETELKGKRLDELTLENAQLRAEIEAKTYFSKTDIIKEISEEMNSPPKVAGEGVRDYGGNQEGSADQ